MPRRAWPTLRTIQLPYKSMVRQEILPESINGDQNGQAGQDFPQEFARRVGKPGKTRGYTDEKSAGETADMRGHIDPGKDTEHQAE